MEVTDTTRRWVRKDVAVVGLGDCRSLRELDIVGCRTDGIARRLERNGAKIFGH